MFPIRYSLTALTAAKKGCLFLLILIIFTAQPYQAFAEPQTFKDTKGHWAQPYIEWAVDQKLAQGYSDGSFQPNRLISEAEFIAMLLRAYDLVPLSSATTGPWSKPYYDYVNELGWPVLSLKTATNSFPRGQAALLMASAANGNSFSEQSAVQWLLDEKISNGRTSATINGFIPDGKLTRAEALTFFYNLKLHFPNLSTKKIIPAAETTLGGIALNDSLQKLEKLLGKPSRIDLSEYGFSWYVYNESYTNLMMFGVKNDLVEAQFSNAGSSWKNTSGIQIGQPLAEAKMLISSPNKAVTGENDYAYTAGNVRTSLFIDKQDHNKIIGIIRMNNTYSTATKSAYTSKLEAAFEQQTFDLANAERAVRNIPTLAWDKLAAASARSHSLDMATRRFFDHTNPDGFSPFDRMKTEGIKYHSAAENIAAGYSNSFYAHYGWINSETGHRETLLSTKYTRLGTGIAFNGKYNVYYTQNFYTP